MLLSRISILISGALLAVLVLARIAVPEWVVGKNLGFVLALGLSAAFFLGLAELRGLGSSTGSLGRPLSLFSSFFTTSALDVLLGLDNLLPAATPSMYVAFSPLFLFLVAAWWLALTKTTKELDRLRPIIWLTFAASAGCVVALVVYWRGHAS